MKYKITYFADDQPVEEVEAAHYGEQGEWIIFEDGNGEKLRIRADQVLRIDRL
ncbi:MAG TPA: hypothetical protein VIM19_04870 [Actinomycetes bacterium]